MHCRVDAASVEWIGDVAGLRDAAADWEPVIGLDTEFQRTNTFYPIAALYQVISGNAVYFLDPLSIGEWEPFARVLADPGTIKIIHACSEDLELLDHHLVATPRAVFDTQLANAFQTTDYSSSYAKLTEDLLGVQLGKHHTRSDWLRRPLSDDQLAYALDDVCYLPALHAVLADRLRDLGRTTWFQDAMDERARPRVLDPLEYYRGVKKAWRLNGSQLAVLQALCAWREQKARTENVPRNRVVWDEHLYAFSLRSELKRKHVADLLPGKVARRYADDLVATHRACVASGAVLEPLPPPLTQAQGRVCDALRHIGKDTAKQLGMAAELLARKRDVEACVRHYLATGELSASYQGWRGELLGERFRSVLQEQL